MSDLRQLALVVDVETKREQQSARNYQLAQQNVNENRTKLQGLEDYRLNYLKMLQQKGKEGLKAKNMHQHHSFIGKLDKACEQQTQFLKQASLAAEERKRQWLTHQKKRKAIEHLIANKQTELTTLEAKKEQHMFDELALQKFFRQNNS